MSPIIRFFTSIRVAITLLIILIIASILGTFIPQGRSHEEYLVRYGQLAGLLEKLQFTRLYHSFWYIALLFFFSLNLVICTLVRLKPKLKRAFRPSLAFTAADLLALRTHSSINLSLPLDVARKRLREILKVHRYHLREKNIDSRVALLARKKNLGLFGSDIVHLAILTILAGGMISGLAAFRTDLALHEKEAVPVPRADFSIRLDAFETEFYPNGQVKDWKSTLTVLEKGKEILTRTIEVNYPLNYRNYMFYQSAYGWDWDQASLEILIRPGEDQGAEKAVRLRVGEKATIDESLALQAIRFFPDFVLDENRRPASRSPEPNNPAAFIEVTRGEEKIFSGWIFARFPDFGRLHPGGSAPLTLELKGYSASQYSVIHVSRDPGTGFIWGGCVLIMLGLGLAFYWPSREIRFLLEPNESRINIVAGGIASKSRENFEREFEAIISSLRKKP